MQRLHRIVRILVAVLVLVSLGALLGCGDDDDDEEGSIDITGTNAAFLLGGKTFTFTDIVFDVTNATFAFNASATRFVLQAGNNTARGAVAYDGSCIFTVQASNFPAGTGPQVNQQLTADPCGLNEDADALILDDATSSSTGLISSDISF